jgi:hypothetical protein
MAIKARGGLNSVKNRRVETRRGTMNVEKVIAELREERACLDEVIISLEKLQSRRTPRRGRPPSWLTVSPTNASKKVNAPNTINKGRLSAAQSA